MYYNPMGIIIFEYFKDSKYHFTNVHMCGTVHICEQCKAQICEPFHQNHVFIWWIVSDGHIFSTFNAHTFK